MSYHEVLLIADHVLSLLGSGIIVYAGLKAAYLFCKGTLTNKLDLNRLGLSSGMVLSSVLSS